MKQAAIGAMLLISLSPRPARASGHAMNAVGDAFAPFLVLGVVLILVAPSDLGAVIPARDPGGNTQFVLGWSWQIPVPLVRDGALARSNHHLLGGFDYLPESDSGHILGRFGYRYSRSRLIAGLTTAFGDGWTWSPEIGIKLVHGFEPDAPIDPSVHLLARANVDIDFRRFDGVTVLLGWSLL